jgi:predicted phosphoribosyltransferase
MFFDRYDAGQRLAQRLAPYKDSNAIVYALPRGGVVLGYEIATALNLKLDIVITRKIGHPLDKEVAVCAITEYGELVCDEQGLCGIDESWIEAEVHTEQKEAHRRRSVYSTRKRPLSARGKIAIVVDDGIATGLTIKAAIRALQKQHPRKVVAAVPICPPEVWSELEVLTDETIVLIDDEHYLGSVGAYYENFPQLSDAEVVSLLTKADKLYKKRRESVRLTVSDCKVRTRLGPTPRLGYV